MTNEWSNLAIQEKFRKNTLIFIFSGANKNLGHFNAHCFCSMFCFAHKHHERNIFGANQNEHFCVT
jgi:hypothetical protein